MRKVKATLSVLVGKDTLKMDKIVELYLNNSTIYVGEENNDVNKDKFDFMDFLNRDERTNMNIEKEKIKRYGGSRSPSWKLSMNTSQFGRLGESKINNLCS